MPINPTGTLLTFTNSASASVNLWASDISRAKIIEPFVRIEFSNDKLRSAKNDQGGLPMITQNIANIPMQVSITCAGDSPRPLGPETTANLNSINQKFTTFRYTLRGTPTPLANLEVVATQALDHANRLQKFTYHQTKVQSDVSYNDLINVYQAETFSYLTSTGVTLSGNALGGTLTNVLVVSFSIDVSHEVTLDNGLPFRMATWEMVVDQRAISSQGS